MPPVDFQRQRSTRGLQVTLVMQPECIHSKTADLDDLQMLLETTTFNLKQSSRRQLTLCALLGMCQKRKENGTFRKLDIHRSN